MAECPLQLNKTRCANIDINPVHMHKNITFKKRTALLALGGPPFWTVSYPVAPACVSIFCRAPRVAAISILQVRVGIAVSNEVGVARGTCARIASLYMLLSPVRIIS